MWTGLIRVAAAVLACASLAPGAVPPRENGPALDSESRPEILLGIIHREVGEMGSRPGEGLIQHEFFVGDDDDDTNKDIHVSIVIQPEGSGAKMTLLVSTMRRSAANRRVALTTGSRSLTCLLTGDNIDIVRNGFEDQNLEIILEGVLRAVRDKKALLREEIRRRESAAATCGNSVSRAVRPHPSRSGCRCP